MAANNLEKKKTPAKNNMNQINYQQRIEFIEEAMKNSQKQENGEFSMDTLFEKEGYDDDDSELESISVTMDSAIPEYNVGYKLLIKMGWKQNTGLGKSGSGIVDPIRIDLKEDKLGLGKKEIDDWYTEATNIKRKTMESELEMTPELVKMSEEKREKEENLQQELSDINKVFYCRLCNKQYKMITEYEKHLDSYDHNHKKRFQEMKQIDGMRKKNERQKREQRREEKQISKMYSAALKSETNKNEEQYISISTPTTTSVLLQETQVPMEITQEQKQEVQLNPQIPQTTTTTINFTIPKIRTNFVTTSEKEVTY